MLRLLSSKDFWKPSEPCHVGTHWIALTEYFQMGTHLLGFRSFFSFFAYPFCIVKLACNQQHKGEMVYSQYNMWSSMNYNFS